jgi:hypothetical protein
MHGKTVNKNAGKLGFLQVFETANQHHRSQIKKEKQIIKLKKRSTLSKCHTAFKTIR